MAEAADSAASELLAAYLDELRYQRRLSIHTLAAYRRDIGYLLRQAGTEDPRHLRAVDIRRFVARLAAQGLSGRSLARALSAWRGFFRWLCRKRGAGGNPCVGVRAPKSKRGLPAALSPDQTQALLDGDSADVLESRDKAMFELLYSSGLRLSELAALDTADAVCLAGGEITVSGKRGKTRSVPVGTAARNAVARWLQDRGQIAHADEQALFVSRRGTRLSLRMIQVRLERWGKRHGAAVGVHPHMLRHSFASHILQSSGDLRAVQEMLGHASIATTQVYTHLDFQHLARVYDAAHPRARKK